MALPVAPMALPAADDDNGGRFTTRHVVDTHVRGKALSVVYTNDPVSVESSIQTMEQFLAEDKYRVVGFDLEYTIGHAGHDQKVVVAQLCVRHDVLVYHYHLAQGLASVSLGLSIAPTTIFLRWTPPTI